jgi:hypothetical protein
MKEIEFFQIPDELSLLEFFESGPKDSEPSDGYWCYEFIDSTGMKLRLSFDAHEASIQTAILKGDQSIATVVQEGATRLFITNSELGQILKGEFNSRNSHTTLLVELRPIIKVQWSTLMDEK